jgi:hypothetical protein
MHKRKPIIHLALLAVFLAVTLLPAMPAFAALGIISVQPNLVTGLTSVELVVTGTDFLDGAVVIVENFGALSTSFVSPTVLTASLPAGIDPGVYAVTVVNPDSESVTLPNALRVQLPTATVSPPPVPTSTLAPASRPLIVVASYTAGDVPITPGKPYNLVIKLENMGKTLATNLTAVFPPGDFIPRDTGGVLAVSEIDAGETQKLTQPVTASYELIGKAFATIIMQVSYYDPAGIAYQETFNLALPVVPPKPGAFNTATPTPTVTPIPPTRPQFVIVNYHINELSLQPGSRFTLSMDVQNKGAADALQVSMILGGGSSAPGVPQGTPGAGGVSGGSSDLGNFATVSSSNVQYLGDVAQGEELQTSAELIVNATTNPGAYPLKISFTYSDKKGSYYTDDQVITLLVYALPQVEVNFYRPPDPYFVGQTGLLPLQVVNVGRKSVVLGTMKVDAAGAQFSNNETLVGALDVGGYYTLDALMTPDFAGQLELIVTIGYSDDFSQRRVLTDTLTVEVMEAEFIEPPPGEGGMEGGPEGMPPEQPETFWQKAWRFILGLLGLDSSVPAEQPGEMPPGEEMPLEDVPVVPAPAGPKG